MCIISALVGGGWSVVSVASQIALLVVPIGWSQDRAQELQGYFCLCWHSFPDDQSIKTTCLGSSPWEVIYNIKMSR
jgi:hypothetical protein